MRRTLRAGWILGGWVIALGASVIPPLWILAGRIERNSLGRYVDADGVWTPLVYWTFLGWWLPIALPVSALALACMFLNRPANPR
jgi:hypothetical protein